MKTILTLTLFAMLATGAMLVSQPDPMTTGSVSKEPMQRNAAPVVPGRDAVMDRP